MLQQSTTARVYAEIEIIIEYLRNTFYSQIEVLPEEIYSVTCSYFEHSHLRENRNEATFRRLIRHALFYMPEANYDEHRKRWSFEEIS